MNDARAPLRFVEIDIEIKRWMEELPGVAELRPGRCPGCNAPGIDPDHRVILHGHGVRGRSLWGPPEAEGEPAAGGLLQRRYQCQRCKAVIVIRPRGVLTRRRYMTAAIVLALWLWAGEMMTDAEVRRRVSIRPQPGTSRPERWTTLRRWAKAARDGELWTTVSGSTQWSLRACAERAARIVLGLAAPEGGSLRARAFAGAALAR